MELPFDGDTGDPRQRCVHGTFIGSWWGPDYLCGWCEDGISVAEMNQILANQRIYNAREQLQEGTRVCEAIATCMAELNQPYRVQLAQGMTEMVWNDPKFSNAWRLRHLV